jgi:flagellar hook-basal body complex protein FliE
VRVELLQPPFDSAPLARSARGDGDEFARALDAVGSVLEGAQRAEDAFANGAGTLQDAVYERARADVVLSVATATVQRAAQAVQSLLNMQV